MNPSYKEKFDLLGQQGLGHTCLNGRVALRADNDRAQVSFAGLRFESLGQPCKEPISIVREDHASQARPR
jgi:hypothetical protein